MPHLHLLVGPNGSGKSSFVRDVLQPAQPEGVELRFINADNIARERWPNAQAEHSYDAMRIADNLRHRMIYTGESFIAETVFSHPSKLELIQLTSDYGFSVHVHVIMVPVDLAVQRVQDRVLAGEHDVPEQKIRERYRRIWPHVVEAVGLAHVVDVYDNSSARTPFRHCARFQNGVVLDPPAWPTWVPSELLSLS